MRPDITGSTFLKHATRERKKEMMDGIRLTKMIILRTWQQESGFQDDYGMIQYSRNIIMYFEHISAQRMNMIDSFRRNADFQAFLTEKRLLRTKSWSGIMCSWLLWIKKSSTKLCSGSGDVMGCGGGRNVYDDKVQKIIISAIRGRKKLTGEHLLLRNMWFAILCIPSSAICFVLRFLGTSISDPSRPDPNQSGASRHVPKQ